MFAATLREFAANTSMHGAKYVVEKRMRPGERRFWIVVLILSTIGCIYMVALLWNDFISRPTRVYTETTQAATNVIPFPAITICNINTISKIKVKEFVSQLNLYGEDRATVENAFGSLLAFKIRIRSKFESRDLEMLERIFVKNRYSVYEVMRSVSRTCDEVLVKCSWLGRIVKCAKIFRENMYSDGFCCSFNYNALHPGLNEKNSSVEEYEYKYMLYPGFMMGLSVLLDPHEEKEKLSYCLTNGMEAIVHHSDDCPGSKSYRKTLSTGLQTFIQISGSTLQCSDEVAMLSSDKRGCIFDSEKRLRFFNKYTQNNCYLECEILFVLNKCGCMPYFRGIGVGPVCSPTRINCLYSIKYHNYSKIECDCPSKCTTINYDITATSTVLVNSQASTWSFMTDTNITTDSILVTAFFVSQTQEISNRDVVSSTIYLLASFGGIFGLFLGSSLITGSEIVYYLIVKLIIDRNIKNAPKKRDNRQKKKRPPSFIYEPRAYLP